MSLKSIIFATEFLVVLDLIFCINFMASISMESDSLITVVSLFDPFSLTKRIASTSTDTVCTASVCMLSEEVTSFGVWVVEEIYSALSVYILVDTRDLGSV